MGTYWACTKSVVPREKKRERSKKGPALAQHEEHPGNGRELAWAAKQVATSRQAG